MPLLFVIVLALLCFLSAACGSRSGKSFVPSIQGYQDNQKKQFVLPGELLEISGLVHLREHEVAAINDEKGQVFFLNLDSNSIVAHRFKGKGDYEEIVKTDSNFYVLDSKGDLIEINARTFADTTYRFGIKGKVEFESLVWYKKLNKLVLITKEQRKKTRAGISAYSFDLASKEFDHKPMFEITLKDIFVKLENYNADCKPSGAAINPVNNHLYIIASIGKLLLECTVNGELLKIYKINPTHFPQPEGISFAANGDMYISNEGLEGKATILKYPYVAKK
jgi:hypothetical protein